MDNWRNGGRKTGTVGRNRTHRLTLTLLTMNQLNHTVPWTMWQFIFVVAMLWGESLAQITALFISAAYPKWIRHNGIAPHEVRRIGIVPYPRGDNRK